MLKLLSRGLLFMVLLYFRSNLILIKLMRHMDHTKVHFVINWSMFDQQSSYFTFSFLNARQLCSLYNLTSIEMLHVFIYVSRGIHKITIFEFRTYSIWKIIFIQDRYCNIKALILKDRFKRHSVNGIKRG